MCDCENGCECKKPIEQAFTTVAKELSANKSFRETYTDKLNQIIYGAATSDCCGSTLEEKCIKAAEDIISQFIDENI